MEAKPKYTKIIIQPKILFFDVETSPNVGYSWGIWEQNIIKVITPWHLLSFSAKWLHGPQVTKGLIDYPHYHKDKDKDSDKALVKEIWHLFDEASIIVAHNGDQFDIKKCSARFSFHGLTPPSPYKTIDTLKIAKKNFAFNSNKLDELGKTLKIGEKLKHEGFELWEGCMAGDKKSWEKMKKYNSQDTRLLEKLYLEFLPWIPTHPARMMTENKYGKCGRCGSKKLVSRGTEIARNKKYRRLKCLACAGWQQIPL